jgi:DNA (cytosine-5)-methyltransferase 1
VKIGSLFSGIGGFELGLEWAGLGETEWQVEIDPFCRARLARHWPHVERFDDVRSVGAHNLSPVDLICGGFPCQDVSAGGRKAGLDGARSGLWKEFRRVVDEVQPAWVVVENVASGARLWVDFVRNDLGELGYESLPIPLSARYVGAPHERARIFVIAHADSIAIRKLEQRRSEGRPRLVRPEREPEPGQSVWRGVEPRMGHVDDGLSTRLDAAHRRALGNAVVPQMAQVVGQCIRFLSSG